MNSWKWEESASGAISADSVCQVNACHSPLITHPKNERIRSSFAF